MNTIEELKEQIRGQLTEPGDPDYDEARTIYNAMIDREPRYIVYCENAADVIDSVNFARENSIQTSIRCGGHNGPGLALVDDGLVLDLSRMNGVRVDPEEKTVRAEGGCTWGDVDHATHAFGMATVSGVVSTTGIGGLTLGGGHGYLTRKYGLTIDNLLEADVVLADGSLVRASKDENPDLFWALRGGGGNFGIVTSFKYQLHPVKNVVAGPLFWPLEEMENTMKWYRKWYANQPDDVYAFYLVAEVPPGDPFPEEIHNEKVCGLLWCYTGDGDIEPIVQPARDIADSIFEFIGEMPYPVLQSMFDDLYPKGLQWYWKGDIVYDLSDEAIEEHKRFAKVPTTKSLMHLYPIDGAVHKTGADETAWAYRDARWSMVIAGVDPDPANKSKISRWAKEYWEAVHPYTAGGAYINFMMEEGEDRVKATYRDNYERLQKVKAKYDPDNFFSVNQNIRPR